jgi:hypothetical protein
MKDSWVREDGRAPAPFLHPEHLELIFETRSLVEDQIHRGLQIHQRLDMLFMPTPTHHQDDSAQRVHNPSCCKPKLERMTGMLNPSGNYTVNDSS